MNNPPVRRNNIEIQEHIGVVGVVDRGVTESRVKAVYMAVCERIKVELQFHYETNYKIK
jgi:hypothetical protein